MPRKTLKQRILNTALVIGAGITGLAGIVGVSGCASANPKAREFVKVWNYVDRESMITEIPLGYKFENGAAEGLIETITRFSLIDEVDSDSIDPTILEPFNTKYYDPEYFKSFREEYKEKFNGKLKRILRSADNDGDKIITEKEASNLYNQRFLFFDRFPSPKWGPKFI